MKLALIMAAVLVSSAAAQPSPVVLFVPGRTSADLDTGMLRREWKSALNASLTDNGHRAIADADTRLAWYADVLDPMAEGCPRASAGDEGLDAVGLLLAAIVGSIPKGEGREAKSFVNDVMYVLDESRRCAARRRVGAEIERAVGTGRPVVIVAYSLGSVVTYQYLRTRVPRSNDPPIDLVTLGSPLGMPELRLLLGIEMDSLTRPLSLRSWRNIHDPADPVAGPVASSDSSHGVMDVVTSRETNGDAHLIDRYLRDPATARAVGKLLNPGTTVRP